jgi:hypothetical protein
MEAGVVANDSYYCISTTRLGSIVNCSLMAMSLESELLVNRSKQFHGKSWCGVDRIVF